MMIAVHRGQVGLQFDAEIEVAADGGGNDNAKLFQQVFQVDAADLLFTGRLQFHRGQPGQALGQCARAA